MQIGYYSNLRKAERIIFENSLYLLGSLDKKVESFTSQKTPNMRHRERSELLHPDNVLHPESPHPLPPLSQLANDLTKPLGIRLTPRHPVAICALPAVESKD